VNVSQLDQQFKSKKFLGDVERWGFFNFRVNPYKLDGKLVGDFAVPSLPLLTVIRVTVTHPNKAGWIDSALHFTTADLIGIFQFLQHLQSPVTNSFQIRTASLSSTS